MEGEIGIYRPVNVACETSPSYSCLGFVSLKTGNEGCQTASNFNTVVEAHLNLRNAAKVFMGQEENSSYISLAMNSYRSCLERSKFQASTYASKFFSSDLLELLLQSEQESLAKASIEGMATPYFKFKGVLSLFKHKDKPFDKPFYKRMRKYIDEKIKDRNGQAAMSNMALVLDAVRRSSLTIDYGTAYGAVQDYRRWDRYEFSCDHFVTRNLFDLVTTLQTELNALPGDRKGFGSSQENDVMESLASVPKMVLKACVKDGYYDYHLMTLIHGQLLFDDPSVAAEFKRRAINEYFSDRRQVEFFFEHFGTSKENLYGIIAGRWQGKRMAVSDIVRREDANYFIFTKMVDFGEVCEASWSCRWCAGLLLSARAPR